MWRQLLLCLFVVVAGLVLLTDATQTVSSSARGVPAPIPLNYWHNWADSNGVSHLASCQFTNWTYVQFLNNTPPIYLDDGESGLPARVEILQLPVGCTVPWHKDPYPQLVTCLSGEGNWVTMDGSSHNLTVGEIYFGEDQLSLKGHISSNIGNTPLLLMLVQFRNRQPTVNLPCNLE